MSKARTNFIIDAIMFLGMMVLAGSGFVRKYILLSGSAAKSVYGFKVNMTLLGVDRDGWAIIHLYLGYFLFFLLFWHVFLHWKQIISIYRKWIPNNSARLIVTVIFVVLSLVLLMFPFFIKPVIL